MILINRGGAAGSPRTLRRTNYLYLPQRKIKMVSSPRRSSGSQQAPHVYVYVHVESDATNEPIDNMPYTFKIHENHWK